jgi:hypothetical protein
MPTTNRGRGPGGRGVPPVFVPSRDVFW